MRLSMFMCCVLILEKAGQHFCTARSVTAAGGRLCVATQARIAEVRLEEKGEDPASAGDVDEDSGAVAEQDAIPQEPSGDGDPVKDAESDEPDEEDENTVPACNDENTAPGVFSL